MNSAINWYNVIKKEARGSKDVDFGEVYDILNGYVLVQKGIIQKEKFFIPKEKAQSYGGETIRFNVSIEEAVTRYQGDVL